MQVRDYSPSCRLTSNCRYPDYTIRRLPIYRITSQEQNVIEEFLETFRVY